jgi:putative transposase
VPLLEKPVAIWNNQNYPLENGMISFPMLIDGKSGQIRVQAILTDYQTGIRLEQLSGIRQTARTSRRNEKALHTWSFY